MTTHSGLPSPAAASLLARVLPLTKGVCAAIVIALAARFLSDHYGAPAMLMALLLGIGFHFLHETPACQPGIEFAARGLLRAGVALLGFRVSWQLLAGLGPETVLLVVAGLVLTMGVGLLGARLLGRSRSFGLLTGGSVAICGASAAMALAAVLPRNENSERNLVFTVISVTLLSTVAMVVYPMLMTLLGFDARAAGLFLGGTIHDVAQVVGAGYTMSEETGDVSTVVKLMRVSLLAPVVFLIALAARRSGATRQKAPLLPGFVLAFLGFAMINSVAPMPEGLTRTIGDASEWLLLTAVSAVGMKTALKQVQDVGGQAFALVICETLILAGFFLGGLWFLGTS